VLSDIHSPLEDRLLISITPSKYYNKKLLTTVLKKLHPFCQPTKALGSYSFQDLSNFTIQSIREHIQNLTHPSISIISFIRCFDPHYVADQLTEDELISALLEREYDADLLMHLFNDLEYGGRKWFQEWQVEQLVDLFQFNQDCWTNIDTNWPTVPSIETNLTCMQNYFHGSQWSYSSVCSVCSRMRNSSDFLTTTVSLIIEQSKLTFENLEVLRCHDIRLQTNFEFISDPDLNGLMLDDQGINCNGSVEVCGDCLSTLQKSDIPKFALKNELYCGRVPDEFSDLTWIEEMVCCVYWTAAHVI
jgi:hypothetical protein